MQKRLPCSTFEFSHTTGGGPVRRLLGALVPDWWRRRESNPGPKTDPCKSGAPPGTRTPNLLIKSQLLYPLAQTQMNKGLAILAWPRTREQRSKKEIVGGGGGNRTLVPREH